MQYIGSDGKQAYRTEYSNTGIAVVATLIISLSTWRRLSTSQRLSASFQIKTLASFFIKYSSVSVRLSSRNSIENGWMDRNCVFSIDTSLDAYLLAYIVLHSGVSKNVSTLKLAILYFCHCASIVSSVVNFKHSSSIVVILKILSVWVSVHLRLQHECRSCASAKTCGIRHDTVRNV